VETLNEDVCTLMTLWKFYLIMAGYEHGVEENIWTLVGRGNGGMEEIT